VTPLITRSTKALFGIFVTFVPLAAAQSRVYTNADLGRPIEWKAEVPKAVMDGLAARQFRLPPPSPEGPTVIVIPYDGSRDFLPPLLIEPFAVPFYAAAPSYAAMPFYAPTYGGWSYDSWLRSVPAQPVARARSFAPRPGAAHRR